MTPAGSQAQDAPFDSLDVFREEWTEIRERRAGAPPPAPSGGAPPPRLVGIALSGGGIRSATFNLGVLQALKDLMPNVDYLSTVSGGGYIGGWWSAWRARDRRVPGAFPPTEGVETWRHLVNADNLQQIRHARPWTPDPVHHVRLFSNYLTPRKGALSRDLWRAITVVSRNLVLTWAALIPFIVVAVMLAYTAFLWIYAPPPDAAGHLHLPHDMKLRAVLGLPAMFLGAFVVLSFMWLLVQRGTFGVQAVIAFVAAAAVTWTMATAPAHPANRMGTGPSPTEWVLVMGVLTIAAARIYRWVPGARIRDLLINWISRLQGVVLVAALVSLVIGVVAAYGAHFVTYLFEDGPAGLQERAKDIGKYVALLTWAIATGQAAVKGAPAGGGEAKGAPASSATRLLISLAPTLTIILLLLGAAWLTEWLVLTADHEWWNPVLRQVTLIGGIAMALYALNEHWNQDRPMSPTGVPAAAAIATAAAALSGAGPATIILGSVAGLAVALVSTADRWLPDRVGSMLPERLRRNMVDFDRATLLVSAACLLILGAGVVNLDFTALFGTPATYGLRGVPGDIRLLLGMCAFLLTSVILLGWTADPNTLSLHNFYKMRVVRAYLGASNCERTKQDAEDVTETRAQDDVRLAQLSAADGPYHLIHGTLNLTAGSDLVVAQRAAVPFLFSRRFCGSARTGFRRTVEYRSGTITLGTAVAISGAAASPVMGSQTPSTAMSMLLALLNVRLGYWLPTPSHSDWRAPQARLWPFYLLSEFFSHLADTGSHCYITDGGHFDNTGVYALVERGCSTIVLTDCGADPDTVFDDLSNLVRRARIDFGACITFPSLGVLSRSTLAADRSAFVVGTVKYRRAHLKALGWPEEEIEAGLEAMLIVIKPTLWGTLETDINRYAQQQPDFPQQTTADQWFDEAQFESYRRLGEISGNQALATVKQSVVLVVNR